MLKFILKIILLLFGVVLLFSAVRSVFIPIRKNYNSAFVDKLKKVREIKNERKIILYGGSSVGWGISAKQIEENTGIKCINLGHHAGFGLIDFQDFILDNLNPDDIIIFSPEWVFYFNPWHVDTATLDNLLFNVQYGYLINNYKHIWNGFFRKIKHVPSNEHNLQDPFRYKAFNENGDVISHCHLQKRERVFYEINNPDSFDIHNFVLAFPLIKRKNTFLVFPPVQENIYNTFVNELNEIEIKLNKHKLPYLNPLIDNVYPDSVFFDAEYHLTCTQRKIRTQTIIDLIMHSE